jgi:hypothetical protein
MPKIKCHQIRYVFGRNVYRETKDLVLTSQLMRHRSLAITEGYLKRSSTELNQMLIAEDKKEYS